MRARSIAIATILICITINCASYADDGQDSNIAFASQDAKAKIRSMKSVALFLSGNDSILSNIAEDALSIHLSNSGLSVVNRETIEKKAGEQADRLRKEKSQALINALDVGKSAGADAVLTGSLIFDAGKRKTFSVVVVSLQLVDVPSGKNLLSVLFEFDDGKSISNIAEMFMKRLKQQMN